MARLAEADPADRSDGLTRRRFLQVAGAAALVRPATWAPMPSGGDSAVILVLMIGGPSQLETFDPKPEAPSEIRGPFDAIETRLPGVRVNEFLPRLATRLDRVTIVRSLRHEAAPIHETGLQLLQTGTLWRPTPEPEPPGLGSLLMAQAPGGSTPPAAILPGPLGATGVAIPQGQGHGHLDESCRPWDAAMLHTRRIRHPDGLPVSVFTREPEEDREVGRNDPFGTACLIARRLVESGTRLVVVNTHSTIFGIPSWDGHGREPFATLADYRSRLLGDFDRAFALLVDGLERSGRLDSTLVVATGEFGRTPRLNEMGGRDHWTRAWSAVLAGGPAPRGAVLGTTDRHAAEPVDHPIDLRSLHTTMAHQLGLPTCEGAAPVVFG